MILRPAEQEFRLVTANGAVGDFPWEIIRNGWIVHGCNCLESASDCEENYALLCTGCMKTRLPDDRAAAESSSDREGKAVQQAPFAGRGRTSAVSG